jgi:hypothetical protein
MENNERNNMRSKDHGFGKEHDELLLKMREAEQSGDPIEAARLSMDILKIRREAREGTDGVAERMFSAKKAKITMTFLRIFNS